MSIGRSVVTAPAATARMHAAAFAIAVCAMGFLASPALGGPGVQFNGSNQYITFLAAPSLNTTSFTVECWFYRTGAGLPTNTGTSPQGWDNIVPLVTKGKAQADSPASVNCNYFLGIRSDGRLAADFEEASGPNHPIGGVTAIANNTWYHAAVTYNGTTGRYTLYLNGAIEKDTTLTGGILPTSTSAQYAGIATAMQTTGATGGAFAGIIDEARIWSLAHTQTEILAAKDLELAVPQAGLLGRWALNEGSGTVAGNCVAGGVAGTLTNGPTWVAGAPITPATPGAPTALAATAPAFNSVHLAWTDNACDETGYAIERSTSGAGGPFSPLATVGPNTAAYDDNSVSGGTEYCYQVQAVNGTAGSGFSASTCVTTPAAPAPPAPPSDLVVTAPYWHRTTLAWADNSGDETSFEVERSTSGAGGTYSPLAMPGAGVVAYTDDGLAAGSEYCYRVRAVSANGPSAWATAACATTPALTCGALDFAGTDSYVNAGNPAALRLTQFTIEMWLRRDGTGTGTNTGSGGIADLVPLVAKGRAEAEDPARDINYFFGIRSSSGVLGADFEQAGGDTASLNHPVEGATPVSIGTWHHAAVTYDGQTWRLYLDGALDRQFTLARAYLPASACTVSVALGSALNTTGAAGFFDGVMDEVRVWNLARTQAEIQTTINSQITTGQPGLVARWALDEKAGTGVFSSAGTTAPGTITGAGYSHSAECAPFDWAPPAPPADPSALAATGLTSASVRLTWTDNSNDETRFDIERSTTGSGGPFSPRATVGAGVTTFDDTGLSPSTEYCYRVRAANAAGSSGEAGPACATTPAFTNMAIDFAGGGYVTFGDPAALDLAQFTLECWFKRDGTGTSSTTGTGGIADAIPLVAHGAPQAEGGNPPVDMNFMLGLASGTGVLCADFEEGAGGTGPVGQNHPITGRTAVGNGWHHAAATYDGVTWKLYLDGILDGAVDVHEPVCSNTIQHASLASMLTSGGGTNGFFDGRMDEVRIWNYARTQAEVRSTANARIATPQPGLVARWALDEGSGTAVGGSAGTTIDGTVTGTGYSWVVSDAGFDLTFNEPPPVPVAVAPPDNAVGVSASPSLDVSVSDPEGAPLTVTYYGRALNAAAGQDFTIAVLPDAQYYTAQTNGGSIATLDAQNNWVIANRAARNIVYTVQLGDCTDTNTPAEWGRASTSFGLLENPVTTGLPEGMPYGVSVGNHDQTPNGDPTGTANYNATFGATRFSGRTYYGGHYGADNDNWYETFSASGMDFIVVSLEYDPSMTASSPSLQWADALLTANSSRRAIIVSHFIINTGNPAGFGPQGQAVYNALKGHSNLFLMLCGHVPGEGRRQDALSGNTVHTLLSDYQSRTAGGNGWMRILEFSPANDVIRVRTYSPTLGQFEADADSSSQFTLAYPMASLPAFQVLGTTNVASGSISSLPWPGRSTNTQYEWYVRVSDGTSTTTSPVWSFTTGSASSVAAEVGGCISTANPCLRVPVVLTRGEAGAARAISVGVRLSPELALCDPAQPRTSIRQGSWLADYNSTFLVVDRGNGVYQVDQTILGNPCGIPSGGTLFTLDLTAAGGDGAGTITVTDVTLRDCGNAAIESGPGAAATVTIDRTAPGAVADLVASGTGAAGAAGGTRRIVLGFTVPGDAAAVEVYRAPYGSYPLYGRPPGSGREPAAPAGYPPGAPWTRVAGLSGPGSDDPGMRDDWYYVVASRDGCGNVAYSSPTGGTLNYVLGDVHDGSPQGDCAGDNQVNTADISYLGNHYGSAVGGGASETCLDVGPTTDYRVTSRPVPDGVLDFEDLAVFAIDFGTVVTGPAALASRVGRAVAAAGRGTNALALTVPVVPGVGETFEVGVEFEGDGAVRALSVNLDYDAAVVEPVGMTEGALLEGPPHVLLSSRAGNVDVALLGAGLAGRGRLVTVRFRVRGAGEAGIALGAVQGRDAANRAVTLGRTTGVKEVPARTALSAGMPTPFREGTTFEYALARGGSATLAIFAVDGRRIRTLASGAREAGVYHVGWDGRDDQGRAVGAGLYFVRLMTADSKLTRTVMRVP